MENSSIVVTGSENDRYSFQLLAADVSNLPHNSEAKKIGSGSTAWVLDTGDFYVYHAPSDEWIKQ